VFYDDEHAIRMIGKSGEVWTVERSWYAAAVAPDQSSIVYLDSRNRLVRKSLKSADAEKVVLAEDVYGFAASPDTKEIYYLDDIEDLYYVKGSSKPKKIASDVQPGSIQVAQDGTAVFLADYRRESGVLYQSKNGGKPSKIADDVYSAIVTPAGLFYSRNADGEYIDLYFGKNFSKAELLDKDVRKYDISVIDNAY